MTLTAARPATGLHREHTIDRAMTFPMDAIVARYREEQQLPSEVAREHERELKRFLALCALDPGAPYASASSGNACFRAPGGDQRVPATGGSACAPAPSGSACAPAPGS